MYNRRLACVIVLIVIVGGVFLGAFRSFERLRRPAMDEFNSVVMDIVDVATRHAYNVHRVGGRYLSDAQMNRIGIDRIVQNIHDTNDPREVYDLFTALNLAVWEVYDNLVNQNMSEVNRRDLRDFHTNFMEQDDRLYLAGYNILAEEFNNRLRRGLGFLVRPFIGEMPDFRVY